MTTRSPSLSRALSAALRETAGEKLDGATVALAKRYAAAIDEDPAQLARLGPLLLAALAALGMTPAARAAVVKGDAKGGGTVEPGSPVTDFRARAAARPH